VDPCGPVVIETLGMTGGSLAAMRFCAAVAAATVAAFMWMGVTLSTPFKSLQALEQCDGDY
jgi:hypothetical protein